MFDGLLFDLDGTLWDSVDAICISWNRALERLAPEYAGTVTRARLLPCMGMLLPDILHRLVPELDQERMKPILEEVLSEENAYVAAHGGVLYPEVEQTLAALSARCPLFLVSNCQDGYIEAFFQAHGLGRYFTDYENPGRTGLPKADKMEFIVQKLVELGAYRIVPVALKRSVVHLDEKKAKARQARWQSIAEAAAKQSKRRIVPEVGAVCTLKEALEQTKEMDLKLIPYELSEGMMRTKKLIESAAPGQEIGVFIGPEGGFDLDELELAKEAGCEIITLGKRILRTETAGMMLLSVLMYHLEQ